MDTSPNDPSRLPDSRKRERKGGFRADTRRVLRWLRARYQDKVKQTKPDPQTLLDKAERERALAITQVREDVVRAITHKNELEGRMREAEARAQRAQTDTEREQCEAEAQLLRGQWEAASAACEQMKAAYRELEEAHHKRTSEVLTLRAKWRNAQMEKAMHEALRDVERVGDATGDAGNPQDSHRKLKQAHDEVYQKLLAMRQMVAQVDEKLHSLRERAHLAKRRGLERDENELLRAIEQYEALREDHQGALAQAEETWQTAHQTYLSVRDTLSPLSPETEPSNPKTEPDYMPLSRTEEAWLWGTVAFSVLLFVLLLILL